MNTVDKIYNLINENGKTAAQLTREIPLTNGLLSQWKLGKQKPSADNIKKIADYFNVSVSYLMGETDIKKETAPEDDLNAQIMDVVRKLDEDKQQAVLDFLKSMTGRS